MIFPVAAADCTLENSAALSCLLVNGVDCGSKIYRRHSGITGHLTDKGFG
jgi:hypothetical protein